MGPDAHHGKPEPAQTGDYIRLIRQYKNRIHGSAMHALQHGQATTFPYLIQEQS